MKLPAEMAEALRIGPVHDTVVFLTTATLEGRPNIAVQQFTDVHGDEFILMPDLFALKTRVNLNENQTGVITVASPADLRHWVIEGPCNVIQWGHPDGYRFQGLRAGEVLERWGDWSAIEPMDDLPDEERPAVIAQRGVIILKAERVRRIESP